MIPSYCTKGLPSAELDALCEFPLGPPVSPIIKKYIGWVTVDTTEVEIVQNSFPISAWL